MRRSRFIVPIVSLLMVSAVGCSSPASEEQDSVEVPVHPAEFALLQQGAEVYLLFDDASTALLAPGEPDSHDIAWLDDGSAAVTLSDELMLIDAGGITQQVPCAECSGVQPQQGGLLTVQPSHIPGAGFDLIGFDLELNEISRDSARYTTTRRAGIYGDGPRRPQLRAVQEDRAFVVHFDKGAVLRGGPSVIGLYELDGTWQSSTGIGGNIQEVALSPGGQYLAAYGFSTGGVCSNVAHVAVAPLHSRHFTAVDPQDMVAGERSGNVSLQHMEWEGEQLRLQLRGLSHDGLSCDVDATRSEYHVIYDAEARRATREDTEVLDIPNFVVGPSCSVTAAVDRHQGTVQIAGTELPGQAVFAPERSDCK